MAIRVLFFRDLIELFVSLEKFVFKAAAHLIFLQFLQFYKMLLSANITKTNYVLLSYSS